MERWSELKGYAYFGSEHLGLHSMGRLGETLNLALPRRVLVVKKSIHHHGHQVGEPELTLHLINSTTDTIA